MWCLLLSSYSFSERTILRQQQMYRLLLDKFTCGYEIAFAKIVERLLEVLSERSSENRRWLGRDFPRRPRVIVRTDKSRHCCWQLCPASRSHTTPQLLWRRKMGGPNFHHQRRWARNFHIAQLFGRNTMHRWLLS